MPKVGIVISNYNGWQDTLVCLDSLQKQTFTDFEVILIDDASPNDSVAQLQNKLPPNTVFLPQERNVGFAAANNIGMRRALDDGCDFALLLNNDTSVRPDFLEKLLAETPAGAVSCPKMLFMDPPDEIWFAGGELDPKTGKVKHLGGHKKDGPEFAEKKQVSFITFCCVLLPRAVIEKVGYLDETLFMYCEDVGHHCQCRRRSPKPQPPTPQKASSSSLPAEPEFFAPLLKFRLFKSGRTPHLYPLVHFYMGRRFGQPTVQLLLFRLRQFAGKASVYNQPFYLHHKHHRGNFPPFYYEDKKR